MPGAATRPMARWAAAAAARAGRRPLITYLDSSDSGLALAPNRRGQAPPQPDNVQLANFEPANPLNRPTTRLLIAGCILVSLGGVAILARSASKSPAEASSANPRAGAAATAAHLPAAHSPAASLSAVTVDLGRVMCGECCVGKVWGALGGVEGVEDIAAKPGDQTFVVYYDAHKTGSGQFLSKLAAAGESTATIAVATESELAQGARRWVRTAKSR